MLSYHKDTSAKSCFLYHALFLVNCFQIFRHVPKFSLSATALRRDGVSEGFWAPGTCAFVSWVWLPGACAFVGGVGFS